MEGELKLGETVHIIFVGWAESNNYYAGPRPESWYVRECRVLAADGDVVALVQEDGKVIFRKKAIVFATNDEAYAFAEANGGDAYDYYAVAKAAGY